MLRVLNTFINSLTGSIPVELRRAKLFIRRLTNKLLTGLMRSGPSEVAEIELS